MNIKLAKNSYGKNAINLSKVIRHPDHHEIRQLSVNVRLQGDFEKTHTLGDNTKVLPTDTQKNTVYVLAKEHFTSSIEAFGLVLANHFYQHNDQVSKVQIEIEEHLWHRMVFDDKLHPYAFIGGGSEKRTTVVEQEATGVRVTSGIKDLLILKTTDSGFSGFLKDPYTVLNETNDRILSTNCEASWIYTSAVLDFDALHQKICTTLLSTFASHKSLSVQHTLYALGEAVLQENGEVKEITLVMPNVHHIPFNLEQFGLENRNEIFIATDNPYGIITGTVVRE